MRQKTLGILGGGMATELDKTVSLQALADATGLIYDRTLIPEKVVGQAWLISKSRVVTLASSVANYADAPWALIVKFPHPDLTYSAKTITLHPDFNKREARNYYLAQANVQLYQMPVLDNDIATITLDPELSAPTPDKAAELNRALSLPFVIASQDLSGVMRAGEAPNIIQSALMTGRSGLLTMVDSRNLPFARISIRQGRLVKALFEQLSNELAICELVWRKPSGSFMFQLSDQFHWPEVPEIAIPTEQLATEAARRSQELPRVIEMLGGPDVRFQRASGQPDFSQMNPQQRWVAERLWPCLDGFLPLSKLAERVPSDTYTILKTLWELRGSGLVAVNTNSPFSMSGQLGPVLIPAQDLEVSIWDPITAFYIDPVSASPYSEQGHFMGVGKVLSPKILVHNIPLPPHLHGAAILKEGRLIGIHNGPFPLRPGQQPPPVPLFQMMGVSALNDLGAKRLRATTELSMDQEGGAEGDRQDVSQNLRSSMRTRILPDGTTAEVAVGTEMLVPEPETGPLSKFSKTQIAGAALGVFGLSMIMMLMSMFGSHPAPPPATTTGTATATQTAAPPTPTTTETATGTAAVPDEGVQKAIHIAMAEAGFKETPADTFEWEDTSKLTDPKPSFGLNSKRQNMRALFIVWPNSAPLEQIDLVTGRVPFYSYPRVDGPWLLQKGSTDKVNYQCGWFWNSNEKYKAEKDRRLMCVIGSFAASDPGKCIVMVAEPYTELSSFDFELSLALVNNMLASGTAAQHELELSKKFATPAQVDAYRKKVEGLIKPGYKEPKLDDTEENTTATLEFTVDAKGTITKIALTKPGADALNKALQKAVEASAPFPSPPFTKEKSVSMAVTVDGGIIKVEEP